MIVEGSGQGPPAWAILNGAFSVSATPYEEAASRPPHVSPRGVFFYAATPQRDRASFPERAARPRAKRKQKKSAGPPPPPPQHHASCAKSLVAALSHEQGAWLRFKTPPRKACCSDPEYLVGGLLARNGPKRPVRRSPRAARRVAACRGRNCRRNSGFVRAGCPCEVRRRRAAMVPNGLPLPASRPKQDHAPPLRHPTGLLRLGVASSARRAESRLPLCRRAAGG